MLVDYQIAKLFLVIVNNCSFRRNLSCIVSFYFNCLCVFNYVICFVIFSCYAINCRSSIKPFNFSIR